MSKLNLITMQEQLESWRVEAQAEQEKCLKCVRKLERCLAGLYCRTCEKLR